MKLISFLENIWLLKRHETRKLLPGELFWLALGGWAARGLTHIWVLEYLEEHDCFPSEISGTSMWSIIAALYATGKKPADIKELIKNLKFSSLIDPDLKTGLIKWEKIRNYLEIILWNSTFEDCSIPVKIVATDIDTGKKRVFESGSLIDAVRASIWVPGIFKPFEKSGWHYVDGGLTENVPISVLTSKKVIGVSALRDITRPHNIKKSFLGFEYNAHFATSYIIMQKSIDILLSQNEHQSFHTPNKEIIKIHPKFGEIDYYEFDKYEEIILAGYKAAAQML